MARLLRNGRIPVKPSILLKPLQSVGAKKIVAMSAFYSPYYVFALSSNRYTSEADTLAKEWAERQFNTRSEPFWWTCITKKEALTSKRTLRSWIARRTRMAFVESLRKRGYGSDGTRLDPTDGGKALYGTAQFLVREPCLLMKTEDLRKETDLALETIFQRMKKLEGKQKHGQGANVPNATSAGRTSTLRQGSQKINQISYTSAPTQSQEQRNEGRGSQRRYEISNTSAPTQSQRQWSEGKGIIRKTSERMQNGEQDISRRITEGVQTQQQGIVRRIKERVQSQKQWSEGKDIIRKTSERMQNEEQDISRRITEGVQTQEQGIVRRITGGVQFLEPGADTIKTPPRNRSPNGGLTIERLKHQWSRLYPNGDRRL
ncbi:hypothetical protein HYFRA_00008480 [Hymenoscyphus fraxineus]|uniref:Uncharacterized protein n=1 Tax=Hymenoscyphus fraxineus TaxID=746836 RepID=A0A9N9PQA2_9HELO|nr:hypothetical protein HYFRA_00008480 [Hymenoscyphus fraxineus]